jgi:Niemann-Pick C1 protein
VPDTVCCVRDQVETLRSRLQQAEPLISSCPACRNNFRNFFCSFTCSPDQSTFVDVVETQKTDGGQMAVKEVNYYVGEEFKQGFYSSCKDVQFGATNGFAMDLIGGGAKNASMFLKYMGDLRPGLGSPFQISFPNTAEDGPLPPDGIKPLNARPLNCADNDLFARCTCVDCPDVCTTLPYVPPPRSPNAPACTVGSVSCLTFSLLIIYSVAILVGLLAYSWRLSVRHRQRRYERVALLSDPPISPPANSTGNDRTNPFSHHVRSNIADPMGISSGDSGRDVDFSDRVHGSRTEMDGSSGPSGSSRYRLGRGASLLDPIDQLQPRQNHVNSALRGFFYRLGWNCAQRPGELLVRCFAKRHVRAC